MDVKALYEQNRGYMNVYGTDVIIAAFIMIVVSAHSGYSTYTTIVAHAKQNWNTLKCNPVYMPFAGIIMPQPGVSAMDTTIENFGYCVKHDTSMVFSIVMLPFEFIMYMVVDAIDLLTDSLIALMQMMAWLKNQIGGVTAELYNKILYAVIPIIEITTQVRDALAKVNGIMVASLYMTMSIYNTTISGIINTMTIMTDMLIALIAVIVALMVLALVMLASPAFPVGLTMYATATATMATLLIPTIVLYTLMYTFVDAITDEKAPKPQSVPKLKKKK
jgi:hypothetical protein